MSGTAGTPAGWYPDPGGSPRQRYWDGEMWTEHYHDPAAPAEPQAAAMPASAPMGAPMHAGPAIVQLDPVGYWKRAVLEKYADFEGRARRAEYWWPFLINLIGFGILFAIASAISTALVVLVYLAGLALFIPGLALAVRRMHDTNRSGWWILIVFVPFVGGLILLILMLIDGDRGPNQYGPSPKYG